MNITSFALYCLCFFTLSTCFIQSVTIQANSTFGVYWGTFDPPTRAHKEVIAQAFSTGIDRLFVVINNHGHKKYCASVEDRVAMLKMILPPTSPITILVQDTQHAWSMKELKDSFGQFPEVNWHLFSGQENLAYWNPDDGDTHDKVFIIPRGNTQTIIPATVTVMPIAQHCNVISSSAVRSSIKNQDNTWHALVCGQVAQYINAHGLYR